MCTCLPLPIQQEPEPQAEGTQETCEDYFMRMIALSRRLPERFAGRTVALFSHAASVALVGALTGEVRIEDAGTFAPCGIWEVSSGPVACVTPLLDIYSWAR